jgi:hypothetical protein
VNFRRVAAIALVGWYLMAPSFVDWSSGQRNLGQPKTTKNASVDWSQAWDTIHTFDTDAQCEAAKEKLLGKFDSFMPFTFEHFQAVYSECIASDDPRLKGN